MNRYERRRLRAMAKLAVGEAILDIGCAAMPNPYLRGRRVVGLDMEEMTVLPPYTEHVVGDANSIETVLSGQRFGSVLMGELVEHVERPYDLLRKVREHIVADGRLILSAPNPLGLPIVLAECLCLRRYFYTDKHLFLMSPRWMWRMLEKTGYRVVRTVGCGASLYGLRVPAPAVLSYQIIYVAVPTGCK